MSLPKCFLLVLLINLVSCRIIPNYYPSSTQKSDDTNTQQSETKFNWSITNLNSDQNQDLEKLVKQNINPTITSNEDNQNLGLSSPHILKVPVPQPYPVHIPVKQPFTVPIFKLVPEEIERKVPIPVEKLIPVYKDKPVKIIVEKHHPFTVYKPYPVPVPVHTHILLGKKHEGYSGVPVSAHTVIGNDKNIKWF